MAEQLFWRVLDHLTQQTPGFAAGKRRRPAFRFKMPIHVIDSTVMELVANCPDWAKHRRCKAAAKTHMRLNLQSLLPSFVIVDTAAEHDNKRAHELCAGLKSGEIALFDKGYVDFGHLHFGQIQVRVWILCALSNCDLKSSPASSSGPSAERHTARNADGKCLIHVVPGRTRPNNRSSMISSMVFLHFLPCLEMFPCVPKLMYLFEAEPVARTFPDNSEHAKTRLSQLRIRRLQVQVLPDAPTISRTYVNPSLFWIPYTSHLLATFWGTPPEDLVDEDAVGFQYQLGHASHSIKATRWSGSAVPANSKRSNFHPRSLALPGSQTQTMNMAHRSSPCDHPSVSARNCSGSNSAGCQPSSFRARQGNDLASRKIRSVDWFVYLGFITGIDYWLIA